MKANSDFLPDLLSHLPPRKRRELKFIIQILFEEFDHAQTVTSKKEYGNGRIMKIILFGSYARGNWVEDRISGYYSDFDILVVVNKDPFILSQFWSHANERLMRELIKAERLKTPVQPIVHSFGDMNFRINAGNPFFLDILRDGIVLYESSSRAFTKPGKMTDEQKLEEAQKYFDEWYKLSIVGLDMARISFDKSKTDNDEYRRYSAFLAHQATEEIYHCLLLTLKLYSPKSHNIKHLHSLAVDVAPELTSFWPQSKELYKRAYERLYDAYIKARYSKHYEITKEEMEWLHTKIEKLQDRVKQICESHLQRLADSLKEE